MNYRKILLGALITFGVFSGQVVIASQAESPPHPGKKHPGEDSPGAHEEKGGHPGEKGVHSGEKGGHPGEKGGHPGEKGAHPGEKGAHPGEKGAHSGKKESSGEVEITPVKKELIEALKNKESPPLCKAGGGKDHKLTEEEIVKKATKVKKKGHNFIVTLSSGTEVTCAK